MKAQTKALIASIVVIALALTAVSGITYSWFSDTEKTDIDVKTGVVDIELSSVTIKTYSWNGGAYEMQDEAADGQTAGFINSPSGDGATISKGTDGRWIISINSMADRDYVEIYGDIINKSTIKTIYRTSIAKTGGSDLLFDALVAGTSTSASWISVPAAIDTAAGDIIAEDKLLAKIGLDGYSVMGESCEMELSIEAYQSNADVDKTVDHTTVKGENTLAVESTDSTSKLVRATIVVDEPDGGKKIKASEVAISASSSYNVPGIIAGVALTSSGITDLYKGCKATITLVLDGIYADGELAVYHGSTALPASTGSESNTIAVSSNATAGTTTVTIVTYDGFSPYLVSQKPIKASSSSDFSYFYNLSEAVESNYTNIEILRDYNGDSSQIDINNAIEIRGSDGVTVSDVCFKINVSNDKGTVLITNLRMETYSKDQKVEHMIWLDSNNKCKVNLSNIDFITGCQYNPTSRTMGAIYAEGGSLVVSNCNFDLDAALISDVKHHAIDLKNITSTQVINCDFKNINRPINIENVSSFISRNNSFDMPVTETVTQKLFNICNTSIDKYTITGTNVEWNKDTKATEYEAYIHENGLEFVMNEAFSIDIDMYIPSNKKLIIATNATISGEVYNNGIIELGNDSTPGTLTVKKINGSEPIVGSNSQYNLIKTESKNCIVYSVTQKLTNGESLSEAISKIEDGTDVKGKTIGIELNGGVNGFTSSLGDNKNKSVTILGSGEDTSLNIDGIPSAEGAKNLYYARGSNFVFINLSFNFDSSNFNGIVCDKIEFINCTINGTITLYGDAIFTNCTFNVTGDKYCVWTWGGKNVLFDNCTFETGGKAVLMYGHSTADNPTILTINNCTFNDNKNGQLSKAAIEIGNDYNATYKLVINKITLKNGFSNGMNTDSRIWGNKNNMDADHLSVTIDNTKIL